MGVVVVVGVMKIKEQDAREEPRTDRPLRLRPHPPHSQDNIANHCDKRKQLRQRSACFGYAHNCN